MSNSYASRQHPIFEEIEYGYGLTFKKGEENLQIGATGFAPGFVSANFYFPRTKISVIVLQNIARDLPDLKKTFYFNTEILNIVKQKK
jgi:CubicO group peptidase (beta-lactamase class C family)